MAKKELGVCELEEPLICQQFPCLERRSQEECQDARCRQHLKMLEFTWLHGNGSTLLNFTQFHLRRFSLGLRCRRWRRRRERWYSYFVLR